MFNLRDDLKDLSYDEVLSFCRDKQSELIVCMVNVERDFNFGSLVRNANAFGASRIDYVGPRKYDKRGAVGTYHYKHIVNYQTIESYIHVLFTYKHIGYEIVSIENNTDSKSINGFRFNSKTVFMFGSENCGLPESVLSISDHVLHIPQYGSVPSINVAAASAVAMNCYNASTRGV